MAYRSINPFTETTIASFDSLADAEVRSLVARADQAFRADWSLRSIEARAAVLHRAGDLLAERREEIARLATLEMGKLFREGLGEVDFCAATFHYYASEGARMLAPREIQSSRGRAVIETAPLGVLFCIEPWNFPIYQLTRVAAPNLMAGNTLVVKHASNVPQVALAFEAVLRDAGAPDGAYLNAFISQDQAKVIIADKRVRGVALTGSERAGASVAASAGAALKKNTMELGGSDPFIVLDDADLDLAVKLAVGGRIFNAGQACNGAKRFIIAESVADAFGKAFAAALGELVPGDPMDPATTLAPLSSQAALETVLGQIQEALAAGAVLQMGGERISRTGYFLQPTILSNIEPDNPAYRQEFFAPVAQMFRVPDDEAALALANDSDFGLGATIISRDLDRAARLASRLEAGMVCINETGVSAPDLPFGGVKNSGYGRELADYGIDEFVNKKMVKYPA